MKVLCARAALLTALTNISALDGDNVAFETREDGTVTVDASCVEVWLHQELSCRVEVPGRVVTPVTPLLKLVRAMAAYTFVHLDATTQGLRVYAGKTDATLAVGASDMVAPVQGDAVSSFKLPDVDALQRLRACINPEHHNTVLRSVHMVIAGSDVNAPSLFATTGVVLVRQDVGEIQGPVFDVPHTLVDAILRIHRAGVVITADGSTLRATCGSSWAQTSVVVDEYPPILELLPVGAFKTLRVATAEFLAAVGRCARFASDINREVTTTLNGDKLVLSCARGKDQLIEEVAVLEGEWERTCINAQEWTLAIAMARTETLEIRWRGSVLPFTFDIPNGTVLVMALLDEENDKNAEDPASV